jgi:hypothetical protein
MSYRNRTSATVGKIRPFCDPIQQKAYWTSKKIENILYGINKLKKFELKAGWQYDKSFTDE